MATVPDYDDDDDDKDDGHEPDHDSDCNDDDSDSDPYSHLITSIRSDTGLEIAVQVQWPGLVGPPPFLTLSTCLPEADIAPMFHGSQWAGTRVWQASIVALEYLLSMTTVSTTSDGVTQHPDTATTTVSRRPFITRDTRLLELGAGLAVPSLILRALTQCRVVVTDVGSLVSQLQANIHANGGLLQLLPADDETDDDDGHVNDDAETVGAAAAPVKDKQNNMTNSIQACALDWSRRGVHDLLAELASGNDNNDNTPAHFDVILNCDCLFEPLYGSSENLVACQEALLEAFPSAVMLTVCERRNHDGIEMYLQALQESKLVERVEQVLPTSFEYPKEVELYRLYGVGSSETE